MIIIMIIMTTITMIVTNSTIINISTIISRSNNSLVPRGVGPRVQQALRRESAGQGSADGVGAPDPNPRDLVSWCL